MSEETDEPLEPTRRSILELGHDEARALLLKPESYFSLDLPPYIVFDKLLSDVAGVLEGKNLSDLKEGNPRDHDDVNYTVFSNKDGKYAWRPFQLIHPALYVALVKRITEEENWTTIRERFYEFQRNTKIKCLSLPVQSETAEKDKAEQISQWWHEVEQKSIELSLEYQYLYETDITDCYGSIYTHSISWALHTKQEAKKKKGKSTLIGDQVDAYIQDMRHGQTNGIPQGSVLMDFVAEIVLGYSDLLLSEKIGATGINDYRVIRYRDDYRIFVNNPQNGEEIVKLLTEVMIDLGLKLHPEKTKGNADVIQASIKRDKMAWMSRKQSEKSLQKHLLLIHDHAMQFPNAGSLAVALSDYHRRLVRQSKIKEQHLPLISIVVDIAYKNPRVYSICAAIISKLLWLVGSEEEKLEIIGKIRKKFDQIPNTGHMDIWLQRIAIALTGNLDFDNPICQLVNGGNPTLWNSEWISSKALKGAANAKCIVSEEELKELDPVVPSDEVALFMSNSWES